MIGFGAYTFIKEHKQKSFSRIIIASMPVYTSGHLGNVLKTVHIETFLPQYLWFINLFWALIK